MTGATISRVWSPLNYACFLPLFSISVSIFELPFLSISDTLSVAMTDLIRESPIGQVIRFVTRGKYLRYPEEIAGFEIPWEGVANASVQEKLADLSNGSNHEQDEKDSERDVEKDLEAEELARKTTTRGSLGTPLGTVATINRTKSREQTLPYSAERFQTELQEEAERQQSAVIVPQRTSDGIILVDWYTTDE
jgi:DHA1 family multidrug resistance protein-like MFS transporter